MINENMKSFPDQLLKSTYDEALIQNEIHESHWKNFKAEHEALCSRLLTLREKLKHDVMVPIGKLALMKGKLVHTNEILVSLGDGWFAKKSATEASEVCERRIKDCNEMLDKLKKERDLFSSRTIFPKEHDLFSDNEIIEPYDEASEAEWREKHKERVRAHKQEEAKKRCETKIKDEDDLFDLLDALELQEEEEDEFNRMDLDHDHQNDNNEEHEEDSVDDDDDSYSEDERENDSKEIKDSFNSKISETVEINSSEKEKSAHDYLDSKGIRNIEPNSNLMMFSDKLNDHSLHTKRDNFKNNQKVSFAEVTNSSSSEEEIDPVIIHFKHTDVKKLDNCDNRSETQNTINSPSDIYKSVINLTGLPKSILKKSDSFSNASAGQLSEDGLHTEDKKNLDDIRKNRSEVNQQVKVGDVIEHSDLLPPAHTSSARPVSKFKASRQASKK